MSDNFKSSSKNQPRYTISVLGESTGWEDTAAVIAPSDGRQKSDSYNFVNPNINPSEDSRRAAAETGMMNDNSYLPHISRSKSLREFPASGGYSFVKDLEMSTTPIFQFKQLSTGDANASEKPDQPSGRKESQRTISEAMEKLMPDALPNSGKKDGIPAIHGFGSGTDADMSTLTPMAGGMDSLNSETNNLMGRLKQRAQSEPARARKAYKPSDETHFGAGAPGKSSGTALENRTQEDDTHTNDPNSNRMPPINSEQVWDFNVFGDPNSRGAAAYEGWKPRTSPSSESAQKLKKKKKPKHHEKDAVNVLHGNVRPEVTLAKITVPEHAGGELEGEGQTAASDLQNTGFKFGDINTEKENRKRLNELKGSNSPKVLPRGKKTSNDLTKQELPCKELDREHGRSQSHDSGANRGDQKFPRREKSCDLKVGKPCTKRKTGWRPPCKRNFFNSISTAVGNQLFTIACRNQLYPGFPGMQGLFQPDIGFDSSNFEEGEVICEDVYEDDYDDTCPGGPDQQQKGTPKFYDGRRCGPENRRQVSSSRTAGTSQKEGSKDCGCGRKQAADPDKRSRSAVSSQRYPSDTTQSVTLQDECVEKMPQKSKANESRRHSNVSSESKSREKPRRAEELERKNQETEISSSITDEEEEVIETKQPVNVARKPRAMGKHLEARETISEKLAGHVKKRLKATIKSHTQDDAQIKAKLAKRPPDEKPSKQDKQTQRDREEKRSSAAERRHSVTTSDKSTVMDSKDGDKRSVATSDRQPSEKRQPNSKSEAKPPEDMSLSMTLSEIQSMTDGRRSSKTRLRDRTQEHITDLRVDSALTTAIDSKDTLSSKPMPDIEAAKPIDRDEGKKLSEVATKDQLSVGDSCRDVSITLKCEPPMVSPTNNCIQVCASVCSPGATVVLNVMDYNPMECGYQGTKNLEVLASRVKARPAIPEPGSVLRAPKTQEKRPGSRQTSLDTDSDPSAARRRAPSPSESTAAEKAPEACRSPVLGTKSGRQSPHDLPPSLRKKLSDPADTDYASCYPYNRPERAREAAIPEVDARAARLSSNSLSERRPEGRIYGDFDQETQGLSKSSEKRELRRSLVLDDWAATGRQDQTDVSDMDSVVQKLSLGSQNPVLREKFVVPDSKSLHGKSSKDVTPSPISKDYSRKLHFDKHKLVRQSSGTSSSSQTECSSLRMTSCVESREKIRGMRPCDSTGEAADSDEVRETQSLMESPRNFHRHSSREYKDSRYASSKGLREHKKKSSSRYRDRLTTDERRPEMEREGSFDPNHRSRGRIDEDATCVSKQISDHGEEAQDDARSHSNRLSRDVRFKHDDNAWLETTSLRSSRDMSSTNTSEKESCYDRKTHSERLTVRSSSFKYSQERKSTREIRKSDRKQITKLACISPPLKSKSGSSRSSHSINSGDSHIRSSERDSEATTLGNNVGGSYSKDMGDFRRKTPNPEVDRSHSTTTENSTAEENSESTLPILPGELESDYNDDEMLKSGRSHKSDRASGESDGTKSRTRHRRRRSETHEDTHFSASSRSSPMPALTGSGRMVTSSKRSRSHRYENESSNQSNDSLTPPRVEIMSVCDECLDEYYQDKCSNKLESETFVPKLRPQLGKENPDVSGYHHPGAHDAANWEGSSSSQTSCMMFTTRGPRFHYYRQPGPHAKDKQEASDSRSRSNSASGSHGRRTYREGAIDLFQQIITPEQPFQLHERREIQAVTDGVPFYCQSLRATVTTPAKFHTSPFPRSSDRQFQLADLPCPEQRNTEEYAESRYEQPSKLREKYIKITNTFQSEDRSHQPMDKNTLARYRNQLKRATEENITNSNSETKSRLPSASTSMRPGENTSRRYELKSRESHVEAECAESNSGFHGRKVRMEYLGDYHVDSLEEIYDPNTSEEFPDWGKNKNFSSSAERDRNSSSGNGDSWYPEYAYRCGVIDTLRLLDSDFALSTPSGDIFQQCQKYDTGRNASNRLNDVDDQLSSTVRSVQSAIANKESDETFETIRQNSLKALLCAAKLSVDWPPRGLYENPDEDLENWIQELRDCSSSSITDLNTGVRSPASDPTPRDRNCPSEILSELDQVRAATQKVVRVVPTTSPASTESADKTEKGDKAPFSLESVVRNGKNQQNFEENIKPLAEEISQRLPRQFIREHEGDGWDKIEETNNHLRKHHLMFDRLGSKPRAKLQGPTESLHGFNQRKVTLRKAQLSPVEKDRLRGAISRKLGPCQKFSLVPLRLCEPAPPADSCMMNTLDPDPENTVLQITPSDPKKRATLARKSEIFSAVDSPADNNDCRSTSNCPLYVIAVEKSQLSDDGVDSGCNSVDIIPTESPSCENPLHNDTKNAVNFSGTKDRHSINLGGSKKYYIFTQDELIKTVICPVNHEEVSSSPLSRAPQHAIESEEIGKPDTCRRSCSWREKIWQACPGFRGENECTMEQGVSSISSDEPNVERGSCVKSAEKFNRERGSNEGSEHEVRCVPSYHKITENLLSPKLYQNTVYTVKRFGKNCHSRCNVDYGKYSTERNTPAHEKFGNNDRIYTMDKRLNRIRVYFPHDEKHPLYQSTQSHRSANWYNCNKPGMKMCDEKEITQQKATEIRPDDVFLRQTRSEHRSANISTYHFFSNEADKPLGRSGEGDGVDGSLRAPQDQVTSFPASDEHAGQVSGQADKSSPSEQDRGSSKPCRKSKSSTDVQLNASTSEPSNPQNGQTEAQNSSYDSKTLRMLHALVDGKLKVYFDQALKKWTSPERMRCLPLKKENTNNDAKIKPLIPADPKLGSKDCSSVSSEYLKPASTPSLTSLTDHVTEKSATGESVVLLSLPARARDPRKMKTYLELTSQQNEKLMSWMKTSVPEKARAEPKITEAKKKYVLSVKRKRLVSESRGCQKNRRRSSRHCSSSSNENITNSANDEHESDASVNRYDLMRSRSDYGWKYGGGSKMGKYCSSRYANSQCSPVRRHRSRSSRSQRRCSRRPQIRSESRRRSLSRSQSESRRRRKKKRISSTPRKERKRRSVKVKINLRPNSSSPKSEKSSRDLDAPSKCERSFQPSGNASIKTLNPFANSGISRVARALGNNFRTDFEYVPIFCNNPGQTRRNCSPFNDTNKDETADSSTSDKDSTLDYLPDDDSLKDCEGSASCKLTPIKEESRSYEHTSSEKFRSDFETFVKSCKKKLWEIKDTVKHCTSSGIQTLQSSGNTCSSSNFILRRPHSSGRRASEDTASEELPSPRGPGRQEIPRRVYDSFREHAESMRTEHDYYHAYMQCKGPFKSAFLRNEMGSLMADPIREKDRPLRKNEAELMRMYIGGANLGGYSGNVARNVDSPWASRGANVNLNWKKADSDVMRFSTGAPAYIRSVPGISCQSQGGPVVTASQTRSLSSVYSTIRPGFSSAYPTAAPPSAKDGANSSGLSKIKKTLPGDVFIKPSATNKWSSADSADICGSHRDLIRRNWNESANNGNDGSSSGESSGNDERDFPDNDQKSEYSRKSKLHPGKSCVLKEHSDVEKPSREIRYSHKTQGQGNCCRQLQHKLQEDHKDMCCEHACMSYEYTHPNYQMARVSNFAARNINGSGNMFGRGMYPENERMSGMMGHEGESDDEFTSANEDLPHYNCGAKMRAKGKRKMHIEMDDTCNHPDSMNYFIGDGPSGQFGSFEGIPKEDHLISLSPMEEENQITYCIHRQVNTVCQKATSEAAEGQGLSCASKPGRSDFEINCPHGAAEPSDRNHILPSRTCFGQGDIINKKAFTQWYVDDSEKGQRRAALVPEKCGHRELWVTPSENCESPIDDGEEDDENDENEGEEEDDEADENEEEKDGEEGDDNDEEEDEEDDEEDDDENNEIEEDEEDDDEDDDDDAGDDCNALGEEFEDDEHILQEISSGVDRMKEKNSHNNYPQERAMDTNESKIMCRRFGDTESNKRSIRARSITQSKRCTVAAKPGHQQSTGDHLNKPKTTTTQEKNAHSKALHQQKFSLEQIKVPAIEKERVRFACDENGDWAEIGRGSYGCVYLGLLDGIIEVAIKDFYESSSWDLVIHEARMLMFLQDTGITPRFYGLRRRFDVNKQPSEYCIIMEYFGDGRTLFNVMSDKLSLGGEEWMDVVGQLVAGLRLIHRKNVLINDLKADNILIDLTGGRKIIRYIDVGMATYKQGLTFQLPQDQMSKYNFLAPEVREGARTTTRSDIYSLGYMLEQMCRMADSTLGGLKKLVARCMEKNPARRPDIDDIVSQVHRFIASKAGVVIKPSSPSEQFVLINSV